jgi:ubiquinone/menaquinone biosynthesis C-methylase UbiE
MTPLKAEAQKFTALIARPKLREYVEKNLQESLSSIGFSQRFVSYILQSYPCIDLKELYRKHDAELMRCYDIGFFRRRVPQYFEKNVIPRIPRTQSILDVGCGTGILAHRLEKRPEIKEILGIDIAEYPEWRRFASEKVRFRQIQRAEFASFLASHRFDSTVLTWSLHHMPFEEQEQYLMEIHAHLKKGAKVIILEDSYSEETPPEFGKKKWEEFKRWSRADRRRIMSFYDWLANRVLAKRHAEPIPCTYRTLEEWQRLCKRIGFTVLTARFIGFPAHRDINTPQSLLVLQKRS